MAVKFFGQFLIDRGEIDASHVREAIDLMQDENPTLGELAISQGFMSQIDATRVSAEQRNRDLAFGDLAVEMGFLSAEQLVELVHRQCSERLQIGQALVRLGHLETDRLGMLLDAFKADQAQYEAGERVMPDGLVQHRAARYVLDFLPRFLMRVARLQAKVGEICDFAGVPEFADVTVSVPLHGVRGLEVALASDLEFAEALAMAASGLSARDLNPEMVADGVGEFLNVLAGNAASAVAKEGRRVEIGPPDYEAELCSGWSVDLAVGTGRAVLVLSTF